MTSPSGERTTAGVIRVPFPITPEGARRIKRMWLRSNRWYVRLWRRLTEHSASQGGSDA